MKATQPFRNIPLPPPDPRRGTKRDAMVCARLPAEKLERYRAAATRAGLSFTMWLEWALDLGAANTH